MKGSNKLTVLIVVALLAQGCAMTLGMAQRSSTEELCHTYARNHDPMAWRELTMRHSIPLEEWDRVQAGKISMGMSETGLRCSWGRPERINRTVTRYGDHKQWVYYFGSYVYTENGVVTSWQD